MCRALQGGTGAPKILSPFPWAPVPAWLGHGPPGCGGVSGGAGVSGDTGNTAGLCQHGPSSSELGVVSRGSASGAPRLPPKDAAWVQVLRVRGLRPLPIAGRPCWATLGPGLAPAMVEALWLGAGFAGGEGWKERAQAWVPAEMRHGGDCPLGKRVGRGEMLVRGTAEREDTGPRIRLHSAQLPPLPSPRPAARGCGGGTWPCATFQHCLPSPPRCAGSCPGPGCAGASPGQLSGLSHSVQPVTPIPRVFPSVGGCSDAGLWVLVPLCPLSAFPTLEPTVLLKALAPCALAGDNRMPWCCSGPLCPEDAVVC